MNTQQLHELVNDTAEAWALDKFGTARTDEAKAYSAKAYNHMSAFVRESMTEEEALKKCNEVMEAMEAETAE